MAKTDRTYDARAMLVMVTTMRQLQQIENMVVIAVAIVTVLDMMTSDHVAGMQQEWV